VGVEFRDSVAGGTIDDDRQPSVVDTVDSGVVDDRPDPRYCWVAAPTATAPHQLTSRHRLTTAPQQHRTATATPQHRISSLTDTASLQHQRQHRTSNSTVSAQLTNRRHHHDSTPAWTAAGQRRGPLGRFFLAGQESGRSQGDTLVVSTTGPVSELTM